MNIELQLKLARECWEVSKGDPNITILSSNTTSEEELAFKELIRKGVLMRRNRSYTICPETKRFIDNNGKTGSELEKEKEEKLKLEELGLAKESNKIAKRSQWISILSIVISTGVAVWVAVSNKG